MFKRKPKVHKEKVLRWIHSLTKIINNPAFIENATTESDMDADNVMAAVLHLAETNGITRAEIFPELEEASQLYSNKSLDDYQREQSLSYRLKSKKS